MIKKLGIHIVLMFGILAAPFFFGTEAHASASPANNAEVPQVIKLTRFRKALWKVRVSIKGREGDFLLDTGGGQTLLTDEFAKGIDCKFWGRSTGYNMFGKKIEGPHCDNVRIMAGGVALTPVDVGKIDFADQFQGDKPPDGLLSLDAFDGKVITLDQQAATITIETPKSMAARTKSMLELAVRYSRECSARCMSVFIGVPTSEGRTWMLLDSGAGGVSLVAKEYGAAFGLQPDVKDQRLKHTIAPGIEVDSPVIVTDMIMDGNLGQPFMSKHVITFDLAGSRLWITKNR